MTSEEQSVLKLINEKELVELAVAMGNITAPSGYEQPMADFVLQWLKENGFERSFQQPICDGRSNTIGILNGRGDGKTLVFNSIWTPSKECQCAWTSHRHRGRRRGSTLTRNVSLDWRYRTIVGRWRRL